MSLLQTHDLTITFGGLTAVNNVNLKIESGEIRALIGPNGSGKSTFINLLTGAYIPTHGKAVFKGEKITGEKPHLITRKGIARTFQNILLYRTLTVEQNVMVAQHCRTSAGVGAIALNTSKSRKDETKIRQQAEAAMEFTGILDKKDFFPQSLPYGQQRLVEIARALATEPDLLLLDEPAAGMNPSETEDLMNLIYKIREKGVTVLLVEHNMRLVMRISDRVTVLNFGKKIAEGKPQEVQNNQEVVTAYLGKQGGRLDTVSSAKKGDV